jgi:hypothetical protein
VPRRRDLRDSLDIEFAKLFKEALSIKERLILLREATRWVATKEKIGSREQGMAFLEQPDPDEIEPEEITDDE